MLTTLAPLIHKGIVDRLANSPTFQRVAWEGTEAAKKAAQRGFDRAKAAGILEEVTPKMKAQQAAQQAKAGAWADREAHQAAHVAADGRVGGLFGWMGRVEWAQSLLCQRGCLA
eukprot:CAMPEP_0173420710 /NCGR_PEP_ID=MMETSP1357-20121228/2080_1 /TAXON_ID=77926 /ORGANISM="Hemiselmis rufescens, Strain PCC563" /LENGTH=113 /DNA_ID=CAMNT_0014383525 /DNA_START=296 /DNA_END=636 /DNA_ORIENTATION=-